jgi:hypothetical protein
MLLNTSDDSTDMFKVHYGRELSQVALHRQLTGNPGALHRDAPSRAYSLVLDLARISHQTGTFQNSVPLW